MFSLIIHGSYNFFKLMQFIVFTLHLGSPDSDGQPSNSRDELTTKTDDLNDEIERAMSPCSNWSDEEHSDKKKKRRSSAPSRFVPEQAHKKRIRRRRCGKCTGCLKPMCGKCESCK